MRKYKRFFEIPLNRLPWRIPPRRENEKPPVSTAKDISLSTRKEHLQDKGKPGGQGNIDQELILEILKILRQRHYYSFARQTKARPLFYTLSSSAGRAGFYSYNVCYERLDAVYESLAPQIHVNARLNKRRLGLPVVDYGYENYDPKKHKPDRINFNRIIIDPFSPFKKFLGKMVNFQVSQHHYYINVPCGVSEKSFPDICLLLDTSGSMRNGGYQSSAIPWGERSGYHYALLGLYGIIKYLEAEGLASSIMWNVINFSDTTRASGWKTYNEISQLKRHALTPQFGGTEIDVDVLRRELFHEPCLVIILSDGEIYNWGRIRNEVEEIIQPHYTCFIQIGKETKVGKDMQSFGAVVVTVKNKEDIAELMVDLTKNIKGSSFFFGGGL
ncbi:MAG TPA: VWA domain-containing protein [Candidatus Aerophobetes bacterium]|uniref:VWA domain-containing protein n=1 Tax=Aerophobetes bacterium TaxID=2030807 RepID=A0A7V5LZB6_UNCAE|nr:VWA domain-containing protein [Candidatus Aerophobetes bacterium]